MQTTRKNILGRPIISKTGFMFQVFIEAVVEAKHTDKELYRTDNGDISFHFLDTNRVSIKTGAREYVELIPGHIDQAIELVNRVYWKPVFGVEITKEEHKRVKEKYITGWRKSISTI